MIAVPDPFIQVPLNHTSLTDRNVVFTCMTKKDAGRIKWVRGRNSSSIETAEIKDVVGRYGIHYPSNGVSELHIYGVEFADEDVYRCYVGYTFKTPDLNYAEAMLVVQCKHFLMQFGWSYYYLFLIPGKTFTVTMLK